MRIGRRQGRLLAGLETDHCEARKRETRGRAGGGGWDMSVVGLSVEDPCWPLSIEIRADRVLEHTMSLSRTAKAPVVLYARTDTYMCSEHACFGILQPLHALYSHSRDC
jgi:hypothetical protein